MSSLSSLFPAPRPERPAVQRPRAPPEARCPAAPSGLEVSRRGLGAALLSLQLVAWKHPQAASALELPAFLRDGPWAAPTAPEPVYFPRRPLNQKFAVLLLRSAYEALDSVDAIAMDQFQIKFWKLRQAEYEPYTISYSPIKVRQGDLTDANYFDFVSFAQLATASQALEQNARVFEEFCEDCPQQRRLVTRDPLLQDKGRLVEEFQRRTGDRIYAGLRGGFEGATFAAPAPLPPGAPLAQLAAGVDALLGVFTSSGYALRGNVSDVTPARSCGSIEYRGACPQAGTFRVRLEGPATLWGLGMLNTRRALPTAYEAFTTQAFLRASGCESTFRVSRSESAVETEFTVL